MYLVVGPPNPNLLVPAAFEVEREIPQDNIK